MLYNTTMKYDRTGHSTQIILTNILYSNIDIKTLVDLTFHTCALF